MGSRGRRGAGRGGRGGGRCVGGPSPAGCGRAPELPEFPRAGGRCGRGSGSLQVTRAVAPAGPSVPRGERSGRGVPASAQPRAPRGGPGRGGGTARSSLRHFGRGRGREPRAPRDPRKQPWDKGCGVQGDPAAPAARAGSRPRAHAVEQPPGRGAPLLAAPGTARATAGRCLAACPAVRGGSLRRRRCRLPHARLRCHQTGASGAPALSLPGHRLGVGAAEQVVHPAPHLPRTPRVVWSC